MTDLTRLDLIEAKALLEAREISAIELTEAHVRAAEAANPELNAFITLAPERALEEARAADARIGAGEARAMDGLPIGMKDLFCTQGLRTTAASAILDRFTPPYESTVSAKLREAGAVVIGKTNLDEFAMGSANANSNAGPVRSPWTKKGENAALTPGGSSGGSAAAVAARIALAATGTDTGGSIRQPASFTGIVGVKPTYGRCSRWGIVAFASSLDQAGPMTRTVRDAALMLEAMAGFDPKDMTSADLPLADCRAACEAPIAGKVIGVPKEYRVDGMPEEIDALWSQGARWLEEAGAQVREISLPHTRYALPAYYIIAPAECSSNLARYDGMRFGERVAGEDLTETYQKTRAAGFGEEVRRRILIGTYVLSAGYYDAYYLKAQKVRRRIVQDFEAAFEQVDAILTPTAPSAAFRVGENADDPVAMYLNDVFTVPSSLAGLPAASVPAGLSKEGLPLGLQLIAKPFDEAGLFASAAALEAAAGFGALPYGLES